MRNRLSAVLALLGVSWVAGSFALAADKGEKPKKETIRANVINLNSGPKTGMLTLWIESYTSDEDAQRYLEAFKQGGQDAVVKIWQKEKPVAGRMRFAQTLGYDLRVVRSVPTEKGRKIRLITDRPIQGYVWRTGARSQDYPIGWIEIELDAEGKGEGQMIAAAELTAEDGNLVLKTFGVQPMKVVNAQLTVE